SDPARKRDARRGLCERAQTCDILGVAVPRDEESPVASAIRKARERRNQRFAVFLGVQSADENHQTFVRIAVKAEETVIDAIRHHEAAPDAEGSCHLVAFLYRRAVNRSGRLDQTTKAQ